MKRGIFYISVFYVFLEVLLHLEWYLMERRVNHIVNIIDDYIYLNDTVPVRLDEIDKIFTSRPNSESYCLMFSFSIKGVGECFYTPNKDGYSIVIYGFFIKSGHYSSESKLFREGSASN